MPHSSCPPDAAEPMVGELVGRCDGLRFAARHLLRLGEGQVEVCGGTVSTGGEGHRGTGHAAAPVIIQNVMT